jgi:hypothetical protein
MSGPVRSAAVAAFFAALSTVTIWQPPQIVAPVPPPAPAPAPDVPFVKLPAVVVGKAGAWIVVKAEVQGGPPQWYFPDAGLERVNLTDLLGDELAARVPGVVVTADKPGKYRLVAFNAKGDKASKPALTVIDVERPAGEAVAGAAGPYFVVAVGDTAASANELGRLFADPALAGHFRERGHRLRLVHRDSVAADGRPPRDVARFLEAAAAAGRYPQIFLVDRQGKTVGQSDPTTAQTILEFLKRYGG